jgi:enoyl-[acyl-carrier protein] reductase II
MPAVVAEVSGAGGIGLLAPTGLSPSGAADAYDFVRSRTNRPFGIGLFIRLLRARSDEDEILDWAFDGRTKLFHTSVGHPRRYLGRIKDVGGVNYHAVETLEDALKAEDAGVDGLIVEGAESGGVRRDDALHTFAFLQQVRARVSIPIVAAGGIVDGFGMAGAFALGAEGVLMGTRFLSCADSPHHANYKQAVVDTQTTARVNFGIPGTAMRVIPTEFAERVLRGEIDPKGNPYGGPALEVFTEGRMDRAMAGVGESASLIHEVKPASDIIRETVSTFWQEMERLADLLKAPEIGSIGDDNSRP